MEGSDDGVAEKVIAEMRFDRDMAAVEPTVSWQHREGGENFPVALRVLPRRHREHLHAVYGYARMVDEIGDSLDGDRVAALVTLRSQVEAIWSAPARPVEGPILTRLAATVRDCDLPADPFLDLIEANMVDQQVSRYATTEDLAGYCRLSADPVGRIVLGLFDASTPERIALSDQVCTALQLLEHLQDVAEDRRAGRIYLPQLLLSEYGVRESDLDAATATPALRRLVLAETDRAEQLLRSGSPLVGRLRGWARLAVAGFVAGGLAAADGLRRTGGDVLARQATTSKADTARHALVLVVRGRA